VLTGYKLLGEITNIEVIAKGGAIRILPLLRKLYGKGRWRKLKGIALIELPSGRVVKAELHWYEALASAGTISRWSSCSTSMRSKKSRFVLCLKSGTYKASLQPRKVYRVLDDAKAEKDSLLRVIDESGEDYLFLAKLFVAIDVPAKAIPVFRSEAAATS
jgi:hypothetical protein